MKKFIVSTLFLFVFSPLYSQNFDLIVRTNGDSIACYVDSISTTHIYFRMKKMNNWVNTFIKKDKSVELKRNAINKNSVVFYEGSTIIKSIIINENARNFDLIVRNNGDSIHCFIDSVSDTHIYFEIRRKAKWVYTLLKRTSINKYEKNAESKAALTFIENNFAHRYMFAPSAFGIKKGETYYNTCYFVVHDIQYGFSDRVSVTFGTDLFAIPVFFMPTFSMPINEKSAFAIGDLMIVSPYPDLSYFGNLVYGMYTRGNREKNFSVGIGYWLTSGSDMSDKSSSVAFNISSQIKISDNAYFLTENFGFSFDNYHDAYNETLSYEEVYITRDLVFFGLTGFRFIDKKNPRRSLQFGLLYIFIFPSDIAAKYYEADWWVSEGAKDKSVGFIPIPTLSFTYKFKEKH